MASTADHVRARFRAALADHAAEAARAAVSHLVGLEFGLLTNEDLDRYEQLVKRANGRR